MNSGNYFRDLEKFAGELGYQISETRGGHYRLEHPLVANPIFASQTPSDRRALENTKAAMRRALRSKQDVEQDVGRDAKQDADQMPTNDGTPYEGIRISRYKASYPAAGIHLDRSATIYLGGAGARVTVKSDPSNEDQWLLLRDPVGHLKLTVNKGGKSATIRSADLGKVIPMTGATPVRATKTKEGFILYPKEIQTKTAEHRSYKPKESTIANPLPMVMPTSAKTTSIHDRIDEFATVINWVNEIAPSLGAELTIQDGKLKANLKITI